MFTKLWKGQKPVIGMIHLKALPGSPNYAGSWEDICSFALRDAQALAEGGVDAIQIENQFDTPYYVSSEIGPETVAFLTFAATEIRRRFPELPLGINVHLNGALQAMAVAKAAGAQFIRCFNLMNAYVSNSGYVGAAAPQLMRYRRMIDAEAVMVFGDFQVKHGSHAITADRSLQEKAHDIQVSGAQAAILTGTATGIAPDATTIQEVKKGLQIPLLIGSGLNAGNVQELWPLVDGAIVGSGFKRNGDLHQPIDRELVRAFVRLTR